MSKFEEHGRMFVTGKVVKLRFKIAKDSNLNFFVFKEDVSKLLEGRLLYARVFLDCEVVESVQNQSL